MKVQKLIVKIYDGIQKLQKNYPDFNQEFTYCFRGESEDYGKTKLTPTLFRENGFSSKLPDKELINLITDYRISESETLNSLSKAIEGQHFLALSRLLDITFSILPSIFFASSSSLDKDGYIYIFQFPKTYSPSSSYINNYYEQLITSEITPYYQNFKVLSHTQSNERIKSQSGGFILFPGSQINAIPEIYYEKVKVRGEYKKDILDELDTYFNTNESTIYPEKDKKRNLIRKRLHTTSIDIKQEADKEFFYESEIDDTLERINFECSSLKKSGENKVKIKRILRREERDLLNYIDELKEDIDMNQKFIEEQKDKVTNTISQWQIFS